MEIEFNVLQKYIIVINLICYWTIVPLLTDWDVYQLLNLNHLKYVLLINLLYFVIYFYYFQRRKQRYDIIILCKYCVLLERDFTIGKKFKFWRNIHWSCILWFVYWMGFWLVNFYGDCMTANTAKKIMK